MNKVIFWDFQGTLVYNDWMFSKALFKVLKEFEPGCNISIDDLKRVSIKGFPWQDYEKEYLHLTNNSAWWSYVEEIFVGVFTNFCFPKERAYFLAKKTHHEVIKPDEFVLYDDTKEMLEFYKQKGYDNIILSNHVPELSALVEHLGLNEFIIDCISSANVGFEKPNLGIYEYALKKAGNPKEAWMVGDSIIADVKGAEKAGIKSVLVRSNYEAGIRYYSSNLKGLKYIIL